MKRTTTEKNSPLCPGVHYFFCGRHLSPENSSQLHNTFKSVMNQAHKMKKTVPRLLFIALCVTSSCYAHNAAKSAHHRNAETPWTLRRDVDFFRIKSQKHQDGALAYIFQNIGVTNKFYVEFGFNADNFEGGSGANSYVLLHRDDRVDAADADAEPMRGPRGRRVAAGSGAGGGGCPCSRPLGAA